jgi:hypothetical protein
LEVEDIEQALRYAAEAVRGGAGAEASARRRLGFLLDNALTHSSPNAWPLGEAPAGM